MEIEYRMVGKVDTINAEKDKKKGFYPRVVSKKTIGTEELTKRMADKLHLGQGVAKVLLETMVDCIEAELKSGNSVCINGFGTFTLSVKSKNITRENEIRAESISVKSVNFRCSSPFLTRFKTAAFKKVKE